MAEAMVDSYLIHWNRPEWCREAVASLVRQRAVSLRVTVLDNSDDGGAALSPHLPPSVMHVPTGSNVGFTGASNLALNLYRSGGDPAPFCLIGSHDLILDPDALARMVDAADSHPEYGLLGPAFNNGSQTGGIWTGARADVRARRNPVPPNARIVRRDWIIGACLLIRRDVAEADVRFDTRFGSYVEDVDFCLRVQDLGWKVGCVLDAHARGLGRAHSRATRLVDRNSVLLTAKRHGAMAIWRPLALQLGFAARCAAAGYLLPGRSPAQRRGSRERLADHLGAFGDTWNDRALIRAMGSPETAAPSSRSDKPN